MRRSAVVILGGCVALSLGVLLAGTHLRAPSAQVSGDIPLLTGGTVDMCYAGGESGPTGRLAVDPTYGTNLDGQPVIWPNGFSARRAGGEIEVLDAKGGVVATTGRRYRISDRPWDNADPLIQKAHAIPAAVGCGYPWDFVDCTAPGPSAVYCDGQGRRSLEG